MHFRIMPTALVLLVFAFHCNSIYAQDNNQDTDNSAQLAAIELQLKKLELSMKEQELIGRALANASSGKPPDFGEDSGYISEALAYRALSKAACELSKKLDKEKINISKIMLVSSFEHFHAIDQYRIFRAKIDELERELKLLILSDPDVRTKAKTTSVILTLSSLSAITGFFSSDVQIRASQVDLSERALHRQIITTLRNSGSSNNGGEPQCDKANNALKVFASWNSFQEFKKLNNPPNEEQLSFAIRDYRRLVDIHDKILAKLANNPEDPAKQQLESLQKATKEAITMLLGKRLEKISFLETARILDFQDKYKEQGGFLIVELHGQGGEMYSRTSAFSNKVTFMGGIALGYDLIRASDGKLIDSGIVQAEEVKTTSARKIDRILGK